MVSMSTKVENELSVRLRSALQTGISSETCVHLQRSAHCSLLVALCGHTSRQTALDMTLPIAAMSRTWRMTCPLNLPS